MKCISCKKSPPETSFYSQGYYKNSSKCSSCWRLKWRNREKSPSRKAYQKVWRSQPHIVARYRDRNSKYYIKWYKENGRSYSEAVIESVRRYYEEHPEAIKAQHKLRREIKKGNIIRPTICSHCERQAKISAHHEDYNKPLEVLWLCSSCHKRKHTYNSL